MENNQVENNQVENNQTEGLFTQADIDRAVTQAVKTAITNHEKKNQSKKQSELSEIEQLRQEVLQSQNLLAIEKNKVKAEKLFVTTGLSEEEYSPLLDRLVTNDEESTLDNINLVLGLLNVSVEKGVQSKLKEQLKSNPKVDTTPPKDKGVEWDKLNWTQLAEMKQADPAGYEQYMKSKKKR